jgi:hypothetical protein
MPVLRNLLRASVLVLAVLVASCDTAPPTQTLAPPTGDDLLTSKASHALVRAGEASGGAAGGTAAGIIGVGGGTITSGGHTIIVPAGAVDGPTSFSLETLAEGYVEVYLLALAGGSNVGAQGFNGHAVTLILSYANANAQDTSDPSKLTILRHHANGSVEVLPSTVNTSAQTVTAALGHFSRYAMAVH